MPSLSHIMRRAWSLLRQSMAPYSRPAFAAHLRQAWREARNAPVTPWDVLQRHVSVARGSDRAEVIRRAENALAAARSTAARYRNAPEPRDAYAARKRSADIQRLATLERIVAAEKAAAGIAATYTAKREGAAYVLKRNGVEFGRLIGSADRLAFTSTDAMLSEKVRAAVVPWGGVPAALAKVRAADEALRLARIA
ncbi:hypothetical protein GGQ86_004255 [Xanthobacter flavus]|uniref:Uncharacterized protein n=1 Tax=Xanthobacter flavus TaxID=281 RepID=A0A9W6CSJ0_XANFL|nr:hypothetical protein [Xanthobacter flavus]MDR6335759.1 hypothetical protein [Xanthobacter flavus]GLI24564.1 hypothetical protein XFLAVUS301_42380 [Xanthobacter flavus]